MSVDDTGTSAVPKSSSQSEDIVFSCGICYIDYEEDGDRVPKTLHCGHTLCASCIRTLAEGASGSTSFYQTRQKCPFCREVTTEIPSLLPTNFQLLALLNHLHRLRPTEAVATSSVNRSARNRQQTPSGSRSSELADYPRVFRVDRRVVIGPRPEATKCDHRFGEESETEDEGDTPVLACGTKPRSDHALNSESATSNSGLSASARRTAHLVDETVGPIVKKAQLLKNVLAAMLEEQDASAAEADPANRSGKQALTKRTQRRMGRMRLLEEDLGRCTSRIAELDRAFRAMERKYTSYVSKYAESSPNVRRLFNLFLEQQRANDGYLDREYGIHYDPYDEEPWERYEFENRESHFGDDNDYDVDDFDDHTDEYDHGEWHGHLVGDLNGIFDVEELDRNLDHFFRSSAAQQPGSMERRTRDGQSARQQRNSDHGVPVRPATTGHIRGANEPFERADTEVVTAEECIRRGRRLMSSSRDAIYVWAPRPRTDPTVQRFQCALCMCNLTRGSIDQHIAGSQHQNNLHGGTSAPRPSRGNNRQPPARFGRGAFRPAEFPSYANGRQNQRSGGPSTPRFYAEPAASISREGGPYADGGADDRLFSRQGGVTTPRNMPRTGRGGGGPSFWRTNQQQHSPSGSGGGGNHRGNRNHRQWPQSNYNTYGGQRYQEDDDW